MPTHKGYSSTQKLDREEAQFGTMSQMGPLKRALDVRDTSTVTVKGTDAAEAGSTNSIIIATGHSVKPGDTIRITSGDLDGTEVGVLSVETDSITLSADIDSPIADGDTFEILRPVSLTLGADGTFTVSSGPVQFVKDGVPTQVNEDTVVPGNNEPLPVKLTSTGGDINITAGDLNVQLSDQGANADVTRIGDGTTQLGITLTNEAKVADASTHTKLDSIDGNIQDIEARTDVDLSTRASEASLAALNGKVTTCNTDSVQITSSALPAGAATEATLASLNTKVTAVDTGAVVVSSSALPLGAATQSTMVDILNDLSNKADLSETQPVSLASNPLPANASTETTLAAVLADLELKADLSETQPVSLSSQPLPSGAATETTLAALNTEVGDLDKGAGAVSANTRRVKLTDEDIASLSVSKAVLDTFYTAAAIPGNASLPLQVLASASGDISEVQILDTTGAFLEVMVGSSSSEVRNFLTGPGSDQTIKVNIPSGSRISVRRIDNALATSAGELAINLIG